jgi:hypothetical protein
MAYGAQHNRSRSGMQALGRLKVGERNKTEAAYENDVLRPAMNTGALLWYKFEGLKLRLAG